MAGCESRLAPDHPLGGTPAFYEFNCTAFEVEVDAETGEILIHKHVTVGDVGKSLNPLQVEAQDEGAAIMGLGHTLMEHILLDGQGRIRNLGALDYRIPTTKDVPLDLEALSVENADGPGPYGSKGVRGRFTLHCPGACGGPDGRPASSSGTCLLRLNAYGGPSRKRRRVTHASARHGMQSHRTACRLRA